VRSRTDHLFPLAALTLASVFCLVLVGLRELAVGWTHEFLIWNLFLAWIPFALALAAHARARHGFTPGVAALGFLWLLFFPNAPYIVTDLFHLQDNSLTPVWFDVLVFSAFAWTGMLLGLVSLYLMQSVVRRFAGETASWIAVVAAIGLGSFGIYLGRFVRWNSWDLFNQPTALLHDMWSIAVDPTPKTVAYTTLTTGFLTCTYIVLVSFARLSWPERSP
jgi:uncharacterized membrane protein